MIAISDAYILGIKEGRAMLKACPDMSKDDMRAAMGNCTVLMREHSQPMKDVFKGERDFWKNQLEKG